MDSLQQLTAAIGALPAPVIVTDTAGVVVASNAIAECMFGYGAGALIGLPVETLIPHRLRDAHIQQRAMFLDHPTPRRVGERLNIRGQRHDGSEFALDVGLQQVTTPQGSFTVCSMTDLTVGVRALEECQSSERRYRELFETASDMVFLHDAEGAFTEANPACLRTFGYSAEEIVSLRLEDVVDVRHLDESRRVVGLVMRGAAASGPYTVLTHAKDGRDIWLEIGLHMVTHEGRPVAVQGIARDVTERTRREDELYSTSAFRELVMDSATDAIIAFDREQRITLTNQRVEEITGYAAEELAGKPVDLLRAHKNRGEAGALARLLADGTPIRGAERQIRRKDGSVRTVRVSFGPIVQDGAIAGAAGTVQDITESRRSAQLLASQRRLLELIATGTPLPDVLDAVCGDIREQTSGGGCWLRVLDGAGVGIPEPVAIDLPDAVERALEASIGGGPSDRFRSAVCVDVDLGENAPGDRRWGALRSAMAADGLRQAWIFPIRSSDKQLLGVMTICVRRAESPARELLDVAAHVVGVAIERSRTEQALRESERRYRQIFEQNAAVKIVIDPASGSIVDANPAACAFYGYPLDVLTKMTVFDLNTLPREQVEEELRRASSEAQVYLNFRHRLASGEIRDVEVYTGPSVVGGQTLLCSIIHDVTDRRRSEAMLALDREVLEMIATGAPLSDVLDALALKFEAQSPGSFCSVLLVSADGAHLEHAAAPSLPPAYCAAIDGVEIGPAVGSCGTAAHRGEMVVVTDIAADPLWDDFRELATAHKLASCWSAPILGADGAALGTFAVYYGEPRAPGEPELKLVQMSAHLAGVAIARERSELALRTRNVELESLNRQLTVTHGQLAESKAHLEEKSAMLEQALRLERERARRDPLTGALNHAAITEDLHDLIQAARDGAVGIAMVDVDGLKVANDTYGHQVGDEVLVRVARALQRDGVVVGRYGGDEFVAVLPGADREAAERYVVDVHADLELASIIDELSGATVPIRVSFGVAIYPEEAETVADLVKLSDSAMYVSKRRRPLSGESTLDSRPLSDERAARMVGDLVPLLTSPGEVSSKLRLVAHRLSIGAGYDGVDFTLFADEPGPPVATNAFARASEDLVTRWKQVQADGSSADSHAMRAHLERSRRPVIIDDFDASGLVPLEQCRLLAAAGLLSAVVAPLIWQDEVVGMLAVASKRRGVLTAQDAQFVGVVATQVTAIVRMAAVLDELRASSARLMRAHSETVLMLASAAEAHDHTTGRHLQRVSGLSEAIARQLGYDDDEARELGLAAVLHDIGKIRVPDIVLGSSSTLAESEWILMKQHTIWGSEFLAGQQGFELAAAVARSHHERWDGSGYPSGLAGEEIPEAAQITAVADAFDAMTNDRPYRSGRPIEEAVAEIDACSGTQFSPRVVDALVRVWEAGEIPFFDEIDGDAAEARAA
ncbi:MAG: PAS domain S-box protein [Dehalococcoidia bacterium]|nr:MAG: PAS domain S-box protein [Dehalococcoidia bacterium]